MSRENKFRVWDKVAEVFLVTSRKSAFYLLPDGELRVSSGWNGYKEATYDEETDQDSYVVEFWTGFFDPSGKEIFEGDICFCKSRMDSANMIVFFENGQFLLKVTKGSAGYKDVRFLQKEVVGNIHENPELMP